MASIIGKRRGDGTYYYLAESARVDGKPRIVDQRYLGSAADIAAAVDGSDGAPPRTSRHLPFGDVAAAWTVIRGLGIADAVDAAVPPRGRRVSVGTCLALAILNRAVSGDTRADLANWWPTTAAQRFVRPRVDTAALSHRRFWQAMERLTPAHLADLQSVLFPRILDELGTPTTHALVVDVPDFGTFVDGDPGDPEGGGAHTVGLATLVTLDGTVPVLAQPYEPARPDATSFTDLVARLTERYLTASGDDDVTVVVGGGQHAQADLGARLGLHFVGPLPPGEHRQLLEASGRRRVPIDGLPGVTVVERRAPVSGVDRRVLLVHSRSLRDAQTRELGQHVAQAGRRLDELAAAVRHGAHRYTREEVSAEVARITQFRWADRVLHTDVTTADGDISLRWHVDEGERARLRRDLFGRQLLVTDQDRWSAAQVLTAYRARYHLDTTRRHLGGSVVTASAPSWRWTEHRIAVHTLISSLATTVLHLMRHRAQRAGLDLSVRELLDLLGDIQETDLRYPSTGGRPRTRRLLTERDETQHLLFDLFELDDVSP